MFYFFFLSCIDPGNGNVVGTVMNCNRDDAEVAIKAAKAAFPSWSHMNPTVIIKMIVLL